MCTWVSENIGDSLKSQCFFQIKLAACLGKENITVEASVIQIRPWEPARSRSQRLQLPYPKCTWRHGQVLAGDALLGFRRQGITEIKCWYNTCMAIWRKWHMHVPTFNVQAACFHMCFVRMDTHVMSWLRSVKGDSICSRSLCQENCRALLHLLAKENPRLIWSSEVCQRFSSLAPGLDVSAFVGATESPDAWLYVPIAVSRFMRVF